MQAQKRIVYADRPAQAERFDPYDDNVLVLMDHHRDVHAERRSSGGILLPKAQEPEASKAVFATAIASGPGHWADKWLGQEIGTAPEGSSVFVPNPVRAGDRVLIQGPLCGDAVTINGLEHRIVRSDVVIGVVEDD